MSTVCFTGRRPKDLCGYDVNKYQTFLSQLVTSLDTLYVNGARKFISGGAQGFDQLAFWAVNALKTKHPNIENVVYVPFKGQERRWARQGLFSIQDYNRMIQKADEVVYLKDELYDSREIVKALMSRNHDMVDASDFVVALYPDDDWKTSKGGTAECMRYANDKNKSIYQLKYEITNGELIIT
jgi:uncharacterized phage-like protein YoqJ